MFRSIALTLMLVSYLVISNAQTIKVRTVRLRSFSDSGLVVFDLDSVKLYFKSSMTVKYLVKHSAEITYPGLTAEVLLKSLKDSTHTSFFIRGTIIYGRDGMPDTVAKQNKIVVPMSQIAPYLVDTGELMVFDVKQQKYVKSIRITKRENGDYFGPFTEFKAYLPDGRLFYKSRLYFSNFSRK